jgi:UDP-perosamine 4-acetyltransferase
VSPPIVIVGAGGYARIVVAALRRAGENLVACTDRDPAKRGTVVAGLPVAGDDEWLLRAHPPGRIRLVNAIGSVRQPTARRDVYSRFVSLGYEFASVRDRTATIADDVAFGPGAHVLEGAIVRPGARIGADAIVNMQAAVDHDCRIGDHVHLAPAATLAGDVRVGEISMIGAGATVIQGVAIGRECLVAAGAVVVGDVADGATVAGVPAKVRA